MQHISSQIFCNIVADNLDTGILLLDKDLKVVSTNNWFCEHSGLSKPELVGNQITDVFTLEAECRIVNACLRAIEFGLTTKLSNRFNSSPLPRFPPYRIGPER